MRDLIEREDAIKEMALMFEDISADLCEDIITRFGYDTPQELATEAMSIIPSAERKGEWIDLQTFDEWYGHAYQCSVCGRDGLNWNFCPNCGARMKGADNED